MLPSNLRVKWWQLYLIFPLLIALFALDAHLRISVHGHQAVQIAIILLIFGLIHLWVKANSGVLSHTEQERGYWTLTVIRIPALPRREDAQRCPEIDLPVSELKGVLSDTFEIDYVDAESFPLEEQPQKLNKE